MADKPTLSPQPITSKPSTAFISSQSVNILTSFSSFCPQKYRITSMAPTTSMSPLQSGPKKRLDISNLMSPPEPSRFESFSQGNGTNPTGLTTVPGVARFLPGPVPPLSPPISPATKVDDHIADTASSNGSAVRDPILYPTQEATSLPPQRPLFVREESTDIQRIVGDHLIARPASFFTATSPPRPEHYGLVLTFKSAVMKKYKENPRSWLQRERAFLLADRRAGARQNQFKPQPVLASKPQPIRTQAQRIVKPSKASKQVPPPRPIRSSLLETPTLGVARRVSPVPDTSSRRVVAPNREDKDFTSLPDYCPPTSSLPNKPNSLKVDWKGAPIDLSSDPHRSLLHPDEVTLAANLRLDCATYLTSKRRMFIRRLECLRVGKEFRKTDAQQACKIDVNKASKLWTAFEKVGWLEKGWMHPHLSAETT